ncbi:MAG: hypothetical protein RLY31_1530 [Bacteroidota bacterium]|jgi:hypothetical protein
MSVDMLSFDAPFAWMAHTTGTWIGKKGLLTL